MLLAARLVGLVLRCRIAIHSQHVSLAPCVLHKVYLCALSHAYSSSEIGVNRPRELQLTRSADKTSTSRQPRVAQTLACNS
ncbi:hypothetical protein GQ53DRAFT_742585 [Thozetella sp. PMI_491]|nr:hypothetical protein GQ53DRAFT_742585 [Thozetella sp. PMI_491]